MIDKQERAERRYRSQRREFEDQEEVVIRNRDKGIAQLEEIEDRSLYYLRDFVEDHEFIRQSFSRLDNLKGELQEAAQQERRQLDIKLEDLEQAHYRELRCLAEEEQEERLKW